MHSFCSFVQGTKKYSNWGSCLASGYLDHFTAKNPNKLVVYPAQHKVRAGNIPDLVFFTRKLLWGPAFGINVPPSLLGFGGLSGNLNLPPWINAMLPRKGRRASYQNILNPERNAVQLQSLGIFPHSSTTFTRFGFFWPPTPLRLHFLWHKG